MLSVVHLAAEYTEIQMEPQGIAENIEGHLIAFTHRLSSLVSKLCESWRNIEEKLRSCCQGQRVFYFFLVTCQHKHIFKFSMAIFLDLICVWIICHLFLFKVNHI